MNIIPYYSRLRDGSSTYNTLNKSLIALEYLLTIEEFTAIRDYQIANPLKDLRALAEQEWRNGFNRHKVEIKHPAEFKRVWTRRSAVSFERTNIVNKKSLLVGFTGKSHRMMMPTWAFLAALPETITNVVILKTEWLPANLSESYPRKFSYLLDQINAEVNRVSPDSIVTLGVSGGGLPALLAGKIINADRIAAVSLVNTDDSAYPEEFQVLDSLKNDKEKIRVAFTYRDPKDAQKYKTLNNKLGGIKAFRYLLPEHGLLGFMLRRGRLEKTLSKLLIK